MRRPLTITLASLLLLAACVEETTREPEPVVAPPVVDPEPEAAPRPFVEASTTPEPRVQREGGFRVSATPCTLDGPAIEYDSFSTPGVATSPDRSALWVVDQERHLRRYRITEGEGCELVLDTDFAEGGRLDLGFGDRPGGRVEQVVADARGQVFVSSSMSGSVRVEDGAITRCEDSRGALSIAPDGRWGITVFADEIHRVTFGRRGCTIGDFTYDEPYGRASTFSFTGADLVIAGSIERERYRVQRYDRSGHPQGERWGGEDFGDPDKICSPGNVVTGSEGPVVLDQNCRALILTSSEAETDGEVLARIDAARLIGLRYPWLENLTEPTEGVAYLAASHERTRGSGEYISYVFRVSGL